MYCRGFARMQMSWSDLPQAVQEVFMANVARLEKEMNGVDVGVRAEQTDT